MTNEKKVSGSRIIDNGIFDKLDFETFNKLENRVPDVQSSFRFPDKDHVNVLDEIRSGKNAIKEIDTIIEEMQSSCVSDFIPIKNSSSVRAEVEAMMKAYNEKNNL